MPTYEYKCHECESQFEKFLALKDRKEPQPCPECGAEETEKLISLCGFVLKGDNWPGKAHKINRQMRKRQERLRPRQKAKAREEPLVTLAPNVDGERVESWTEAQKLASSKGKETSSYEPLIRKEKSE